MNQNLFQVLPSFIQNLALSAYGFKMYQQRFGQPVPETYKHINNVFSSNAAELESQRLRLQALLRHSQLHVPYYRNHLKGVDVSVINAANLSNYLPVLTKKEILAKPDDFVAENFDKKELLQLNTSGSSGSPMSVYSTREARRLNYFFYELALQSFDCDYKSKSTTFAGRLLYKTPGQKPDRYDYYNRTQYLSSYFISEETIESYMKALNKWAPEFIDSYPSSINFIQQLARKKGIKPNFKPKFILTSSETLTSTMRQEIEEFFDAPIIDHYGCTEMAICAFSHNENYYAHPLYSVIELISAFEDTYSVVTTGLLNFAMPLIRYEIGDLVKSKTPNSAYEFLSIEGRKDDTIITPEGNQVGRMDPCYKGMRGILQSQIIQLSRDQLNVLIVLDPEHKTLFDPELLIKNIKERTSQSMGVQIQYVSDIEKGANGKFKSVISKL